MAELREAFIVAKEQRPYNRLRYAQVPVIDLAPIFFSTPSSGSIDDIVKGIKGACSSWGFFQVVNHGVPPPLLQSIRERTMGFFRLPVCEKRMVARSATNAMGYADAELTKNVRDWKEVFDITVAGKMELPAHPLEEDGASCGVEVHENVWPLEPTDFRDACDAYAAAVHNLAFKLLQLISLSLGLAPDRFHSFFEVPNTSRMRLNHYTVCPFSDVVLGVGPHKDSGAVTILSQDEVGGLQVKTKDGEWMNITPDPKALVVNLGGLFQVWSNDIFMSVEHRVAVNKEHERLSIPFFFNPRSTVDVAPLPELVNADHPPLYKPINWGKFYKRRRDSNFKNLGVENLQIYHYAINREVHS